MRLSPRSACQSDGSMCFLTEAGVNMQPSDSLKSLGLGRGSVLELMPAASAAAVQRTGSRVATYGVKGGS